MLVIASLAWLFGNYVVDDGMIFARVATRLAEGKGWAFNSEPVNAMTSVLWTLVLAGCAKVGLLSQSGIIIAYAVSILLFVAGVNALLERDAEVSRLRAAPWLGAILLGVTPSLWLSVGLETALAAALVVWAIHCYFHVNHTACGLLLGLAILARPDAGLLAVMLGAWHLATRRRVPWRLIGYSALLVGPWLVVSWYTFGRLLPDTLATKIAQSHLPQWSDQPFLLIAALSYGWWVQVAAGVTAAGIVMSTRLRRFPSVPTLMLFAYGVLHMMAYTVMKVASGYWWYYVPFHLSLVLGTIWSLSLIVNHLESNRWVRAPSTIAAVLVIFVGAYWFSLERQPKPYGHSRAYTQAAKAAICSSNSEKLAAVEIGYLGFYSNCEILDIHGLIHPEAAQRVARAEPLWWTERNPRYIVTHEPPWYGEPGFKGEGEVFLHTRYTRQIGCCGRGVVLWERRP